MLKRIIPSGLIFMLLASVSPVPATNQIKSQTTYVKPGNDIQRKLDYFFYEGVKQKNAGILAKRFSDKYNEKQLKNRKNVHKNTTKCIQQNAF